MSVITPVYNGAAYLQECVDSVLVQSFGNFKYLIVDNCSTDESYDIAERAAESDSRISVIRCDQHLGPVQNWNRSLQLVDQKSDYTKFVHADDWIFPDCIAMMVDVAERDHNVGIVSAYRLEEDRVSLDHLPPDARLVPGKTSFTMGGRHVARAILRDKISVLGSPTSILIRSTLTKDDENFFSEDYLHADKESCLRILQHCDFGFVRQVLTFTRRHNESVTSMTNSLDTRRQENLLLLKEYGPKFLTHGVFQNAVFGELRAYYDFLARKLGTRSGSEFWESHRNVLLASGEPFSRSKLLYAVLRRWANPGSALRDLVRERSHHQNKVDNTTVQFLKTSRKQGRQGDG